MASLLENKKIYNGLLIAIIVYGLFYIFSQSSQPFRFTDEQTYYDLTKNLSEHNVYAHDNLVPTAIKPPGFSFVLYIFFKISDNIDFIKCINFLFYLAAIFVGGLITKRYSYNSSISLFAILICIYPVLFYTASTLYPQTLASLLLLLILYVTFKDILNFKKALAIGILWGILILSIPTFLIIFLFYLLFTRFSLKQKYLEWVFIIASILIGSWFLRNYFVFGKPVIFSTNLSINFYYGNSQFANDNPYAVADIDYMDDGKFAKIENEVERDSALKSAALTFIKDNPFAALKLYFIKFLNYFNYRNNLKTTEQQNIYYDIIMFITYYFILILVIIRIMNRKRFPLTKLEIFILGCYILNVLVTSVFFTRIRFRLPFDYLLILINAIYISNWLQYKRAKFPLRKVKSPDSAVRG